MYLTHLHKLNLQPRLYQTSSDSPLPACCEVEFAVPQYCNACVKTILKSSRYYRDEDSTRLLALFSSAQLRCPNTETQRLKVAGLIVTSSTLIVVQDRIHWLLPGSNKMPAIVAEQGMSNLIEVVSWLIMAWTEGGRKCKNSWFRVTRLFLNLKFIDTENNNLYDLYVNYNYLKCLNVPVHRYSNVLDTYISVELNFRSFDVMVTIEKMSNGKIKNRFLYYDWKI